jgi:glycosyltransferase involved in cell wall biosynthesis
MLRVIKLLCNRNHRTESDDYPEFHGIAYRMIDVLPESSQRVDEAEQEWPPFISVIVPVYNGASTIEACIDSLQTQEFPRDRFEIIVVESTSTDNTAEVLRRYTSKHQGVLLLNENEIRNAYGARNRGVRSAHGEILAFTDADCLARPDWLEELVRPFRDGKVGCVAGDIACALPRNLIEKYTGTDKLTAKPEPGESFSRVLGGNCAIRRSVFLELGGYRTDPPSGGDTEFAHRMIERTAMRVEVNLLALVEHRNVGTLRGLIRQSMRYGTAARHQGDLFRQNRRNLAQMAKATILYAGSFVKRSFLVLISRVPKSVPPGDADIYVWRPCLRILCEWSSYIGSKLPPRSDRFVR